MFKEMTRETTEIVTIETSDDTNNINSESKTMMSRRKRSISSTNMKLVAAGVDDHNKTLNEMQNEMLQMRREISQITTMMKKMLEK